MTNTNLQLNSGCLSRTMVRRNPPMGSDKNVNAFRRLGRSDCLARWPESWEEKIWMLETRISGKEHMDVPIGECVRVKIIVSHVNTTSEDWSNQVMSISLCHRPPYCLHSGLVNIVAMAAGLEAMHGPNWIHSSPSLIYLLLLLSARPSSDRDYYWVPDITAFFEENN